MAINTSSTNEFELGTLPAPGPIDSEDRQPVARVPSPGPAVDSNFWAIIICIACFTIIFNACGTLFAFGVFQELYESLSHQPNTPFTGASPAAIDLIGTLAVSFMTIGAPLSTAWTKLYSPRIVATTGGALFGIACILASVSEKLWQFELTQGLLLGLGTCLVYMPAVTVAPTWYGPRRGLAMGIILSGTGVGGIVWAPAISALNDHLGYRQALRISGAISGGLIMAAAMVLDWDSETKARLQMERRAGVRPSPLRIPLLDWRIARTRKFAAQLIAGSLQAAAYYTPVFFFSTYARTLGYSATAGANFIAINNACNAIGKITVGFGADRIGRINALLATTVIAAVASFCFWLPSSLSSITTTSRGLFIAYSILYGFFASAYVSLFPTCLVELFGPANFAAVNGSLYMARGLATLVGTPTAGALIRSSMSQAIPEAYWRTTLLVSTLLAGTSVAVFWVSLEVKKDRAT